MQPCLTPWFYAASLRGSLMQTFIFPNGLVTYVTTSSQEGLAPRKTPHDLYVRVIIKHGRASHLHAHTRELEHRLHPQMTVKTRLLTQE